MMKPVNAKLSIAVLLATTQLAVCTGSAVAGDNHGKKRAIAHIQGCTDPGISGVAWLSERKSSEGVKVVDVVVTVKGLTPGQHAVHIHETAVCQPCSEAKGHFDPGPNSNSSPDGNHPFHMGDLVNIDVKKNGTGVMRTKTSRITLSPGPLSVFDADGSAFIIHDFEDTYCPDGAVTGCAGGSRAACGVIEALTDDSDDYDD
jgi:Cu-Zn family superoxide dismutase